MECKRCKYIRWGRHASGRQRWSCVMCLKTKVRQRNSFKHGLLKRFLIDGDTMTQLSEKYGNHPLTIRNWLHKQLSQSPPLVNIPPDNPCWLVTDATHFKMWGCLLVTKSTKQKHPLAVSFHKKENLESVRDHLNPISNLVVNGYTTDGKRGLVAAYKQVFPNSKSQRCLVHILMRVQTLLTHKPKLALGKDLLDLASMLPTIDNAIDATSWWELFSDWYQSHQNEINTRSYKGKESWYLHQNLHSAVTHILNAADSLFVFINQPNSISNTNHLEGLFGQRKPSLARHRGLSRKRVANTLLWTFHLLSKKS